MKKIIIIMQIVLGTVCISSCKKTDIYPSSIPMKQIFYTEEGAPYVVKSVTQNKVDEVIGSPTPLDVNVYIGNGLVPVNDMTISLNTSGKKIIPVMFTMSAVDALNNIVINIQSVYYTMTFGVSPLTYIQQNSQNKLFPFVDRIYFTDNSNYAYNIRYNQAVFNNGDFIDPVTGIILYYTPDLALALTGRTTTSLITLPAGTYSLTTTFTYFEML